MDFKDFIHDASGARCGRPDRLYGEKKGFLPEQTAKSLREQWNVSGRDNARVFMRLTEADGSNPHYLTAWDGGDRYVCYTHTGLTFVTEARLRRLKIDESWKGKDGAVRLVEVRQPIHRENNKNADVDAVMDRARKAAMEAKAQQPRPQSKLLVTEADDKKKAKTPYKAADAVGAPQPAPKHPEGAPKEPPGREKYEWNVVDESGKPKRRELKHAKLGGAAQLDKRELVHMRAESVGRCAVCYTTRVIEAEDKGCGECGAREIVDVRSEGGKWSGNAGTSGGSTDPQLDKRELVDLRAEALGNTCPKCKVKDCGMESHRGYWGEKVPTPEDGARHKVDVRTEGQPFGHPGSTCKGFHPTKSHDEWLKQKHTLNGVGHKMEAFKGKFPSKSPEGAKKPLVFMMLMGKKGKKPVEESESKYKLLARPDEETDRQEVDTAVDESLNRRRAFKLAEMDDTWHKAHAHKFAANAQRMKAGLMKRRRKIAAPAAFQPATPAAATHTSYPAMR